MQIVRDIDTEVGEDSPPERIVAWMLSGSPAGGWC